MDYTLLFRDSSMQGLHAGIAVVFKPGVKNDEHDPGDFNELNYVLTFLNEKRFAEQVPTEDMPFIDEGGTRVSLGEILEHSEGRNSLLTDVVIGFDDSHAEFFRSLANELQLYVKDPSSALEQFSVTAQAKYFDTLRHEYFPDRSEMH